MAIQEILLLGNPKLLEKSEPVRQNELEFSKSVGEDLRDTMAMFREKHGWGRSITAPQIGIMLLPLKSYVFTHAFSAKNN